jgi:hypothetical protein
MLPTIEEMTAWTPDDIVAAIHVSKPPGTQFDCGFDQNAGTWFVRFWTELNGRKNVLFEDQGFEQRITYLNGYGWIWARQRPKPPSTSPWQARRGEVQPNVVQRRTRATAKDPEDLDPEEIQAVYDRYREQPKKR